MASPTLTTYGRYKSMQDDFANFLGQTGRLCKAPSHLLQEPEDSQKKDTPPQPTPDDKPTGGQGRLKGKARKLAREKENSEAKTKIESVKTYKLYVKNYIPLAQHVADSKSVHSIIPTWIITTLTSIIRDREEILNHYKGTDAATQEFSGAEQFQCDNEKHEHMISVLRRVHIILRAKHRDDEQRQVAKVAKRSNQRSKTLNSEPVNKFPQHLNTDGNEPEEDELADGAELEEQREADATAWKASTAAKASVQFEADIDVSFADAVQALKGLCQERQNMRAQVKQAWRGYADGSVDLGAAAIVANTAIDLARHLEEAVRPVIARNDEICRNGIWKNLLHRFPRPNAPAKNVYSALYRYLLSECLWDIATASSTTPASQYTNLRRQHLQLEQGETADYMDLLFLESFQLHEARHFVASLSIKTDNEVLKSDPQAPIKLSGLALKDIQIASEDLMELQFLGFHAKDFHLDFVDEVSRAMCIHKEESDFRLWPMFAWELFKDAKELLNLQHPSQAFDELQDYVKAVNRLLNDIIVDAAGKINPHEYSEGVDELLRGVLTKTTSLRFDWVESLRKSYGHGDPEGKQPEPFRLFRRHPIFCGLALQSIRLWMHAVGSKLARNGTRAVMNMAHLYNLCNVDAKMKKEDSDCEDWASAIAWEDMERLVISSQPHNVFIGGQAPTTRTDCCKHYALVRGVPMNYLNTSLGRQSGPGPTSVKDILKDLERGCKTMRKRKIVSFLGDNLYPVSDNFTSRLAEQDDRRDFTVGDLCQILEQDQAKKDAARPKQESWRRTVITAHQTQPSALLVDLLNRLNQEAAMLRSCSPRLFMDCLDLVQDIDKELKAHIDVDGFFELLGSLGRQTTRNGKRLEVIRVSAVLIGRFEFLPIVRGVFMKWLKSNGGNGAVSFPKPPHPKAS